MKFVLELPPAQGEKLREEAQRLGLAPEDRARAAVLDLLSTPDAEFRAAATRVLQKTRSCIGAWPDAVPDASRSPRQACISVNQPSNVRFSRVG
jgi:hypothetical protein